jgi:hypothetical protein
VANLLRPGSRKHPEATVSRAPTTVDFSNEPLTVSGRVTELGGMQGAAASERRVEQIHGQWRDEVGRFHANWDRGLANFETAMTFSSDQEAKADFLGAAAAGAGKALLNGVISTSLSALGVAGPPGAALSALVNGIKDVGFALYTERERAGTAAGEAKISQYIQAARSMISDSHQQMSEELNRHLPALLKEYKSLSAENPDFASGERGNVVGEAATWMTALTSSSVAFARNLPELASFQQQISERFAATPGLTDYISQGGRSSGVLYLDVEVYREPNENGWTWTIHDVGAWTLATTAPKPANIAASLEQALKGRPPASSSNLPKNVHIRIETEEWGLNDYSDAYIYFEKPDEPEYRGWDTALSKEVWSVAPIRDRVPAVTGMTGSSR